MQAQTKKRNSSKPHIYEDGIKTDCADTRTALGVPAWHLMFIAFQDFGKMMMMSSSRFLQESSINP